MSVMLLLLSPMIRLRLPVLSALAKLNEKKEQFQPPESSHPPEITLVLDESTELMNMHREFLADLYEKYKGSWEWVS